MTSSRRAKLLSEPKPRYRVKEAISTGLDEPGALCRHGSLKFFRSAASMGVMPVAATEYIRFRSPYPSSSGLKIGIFGLVNTLGRRGMLTPDEERFRRENNDWYNAACPEPDIYGPDINPLAECWFKASSRELVSRVSGYLAILDAHSIAWEQVRATDPGTILYEDRWQVVAVSTTPTGTRSTSTRATSP